MVGDGDRAGGVVPFSRLAAGPISASTSYSVHYVGNGTLLSKDLWKRPRLTRTAYHMWCTSSPPSGPRAWSGARASLRPG